MRKTVVLVVCTALIAASSACIGYDRKSTMAPTTTGSSALLGNWVSSSVVPSPNACSDFKWTVTQQTGNSASGNFSATCAGDLKVSGMASGTLSGSTITWNAAGTASVPSLPSCSITLTGAAELGVDSIRVPYSGDTCLGKVNGVEILRKQ